MKRTKGQWQEVIDDISAGPVTASGRKSLYRSSQELRRKLLPFNLWKPGDHILDVGSGNGRFAMAVCDHDDVTYTGLEIIRGCVDFCNIAFEPYPGFSFKHINVRNGRYYGAGAVAPHKVVYPVATDSVDVVVMLSVFTHIIPCTAVIRNLSEVARVLRPGGNFLSTWFRSPPNDVTVDDEARTVYGEDDILFWLGDDFTVTAEKWGNTTGHHNQWYIKAVKK